MANGTQKLFVCLKIISPPYIWGQNFRPREGVAWQSDSKSIFARLRFFPAPRLLAIDSESLWSTTKNATTQFRRQVFDLPSILFRLGCYQGCCLHLFPQIHHFFTGQSKVSLENLATVLHLCLVEGKIVADQFFHLFLSFFRSFLEAKIPLLAKFDKQAHL